ncbi:hypothetical protein Tco_0035023, partial [Tanacetum coccineum]
QDSSTSAAGGNYLDKMPRECLKIIESMSNVRQTRAIVAKSIALRQEQEGYQASAPAPAPVKAVELSCVTCGGAHSHQNCPATHDFCDTFFMFELCIRPF